MVAPLRPGRAKISHLHHRFRELSFSPETGAFSSESKLRTGQPEVHGVPALFFRKSALHDQRVGRNRDCGQKDNQVIHFVSSFPPQIPPDGARFQRDCGRRLIWIKNLE